MGKIPWKRTSQPSAIILPRKSHGQRSLVGYNPWSCKESDITEHKCGWTDGNQALRAPGHKTLSVYPSLNSKRQVRTVANQGRGERGDKGGRAKKQQCSLRDRVLVSPKWVHITLSLNSSAGLKPPPNLMKHSSFQSHSSDFWAEGMWATHTPWFLSATPPQD